VQSVHAAHEAGIRFGNPEVISSVVICTVPNEAALKEAKETVAKAREAVLPPPPPPEKRQRAPEVA